MAESAEKISSMDERHWGELPMVQSNTSYNLNYIDLKALPAQENGASVVLRCRVQNL